MDRKKTEDLIRSAIALIDTTLSDIKKMYRRLKVLRNRLSTFLEELPEELEEELEEELTEEERYYEI